MRTIFNSSFYLRSNYKNKQGLTPVMIRINLNGERLVLGSTGVNVDIKKWDNEKQSLKGNTAIAYQTNQELENIKVGVRNIFRKYELSEDLSLELIKSDYLGKKVNMATIVELYDKYNGDLKSQVGITKSLATYQKYENSKRHFLSFIKHKYKRKDMRLIEITPIVIHDFQIYLLTVGGCVHNTASKIIQLLKTVMIFARKSGIISHDPFVDIKLRRDPVDRGFLTDEEITTIIQKEMVAPRLDLVRDIFIFSCFTGLAYIDVKELRIDNIVELDGREWIMTKRQKTKVATNIILLDIPRKIIDKYENSRKDGRLLPILSNQKMNSYLKEIADICGINKNLTFHLARHSFATMSISKGVPIESVSRMLGHSNIKTTQIYARITNKKVEHDMLALSEKLTMFDSAVEKSITNSNNRPLNKVVGL